MTDYPDNFANYPKSISTIKSDKTGLAADATPRDVLIDTLRSIDSGELKPDTLVIMYRVKEPGEAAYAGFTCSAGDPFVTAGLVEIVKRRLSGK